MKEAEEARLQAEAAEAARLEAEAKEKAEQEAMKDSMDDFGDDW